MVMIDIIVLGATGFTGRLVARYLHRHPQRCQSKTSNSTTHRPFTFAVAGRSQSKLNELFASLGLGDDVKAIVVDTSNEKGVEQAVKQARVVINCVGPFWKYSLGVVRACAANGIHYVDITGETPFVYEIVKRYDYLAYKNNAIIIPSCGFDSLPSDIIVFLSASALRKALVPHDSPDITSEAPSALIASSNTSYQIKAAGPSGGTAATIVSWMEETPMEVSKQILRVDCLSPVKHDLAGNIGLALWYTLVPSSCSRTITNALANVSFSSGEKLPFTRWGAHLLIAPHNCAIVMRSWGIFERENAEVEREWKKGNSKASAVQTYGTEFKYEEFLHATGPFRAVYVSYIWISFVLSMLLLPPVRWVFKRFVPKLGEGPSDEAMSTSWCLAANITTSVPIQSDIHRNPKPCIVQTTMEIKSDVGYTGTAAFVSEAALSLLDVPSLPPIAHHGGILTPATALGHVVVQRLAEVDLVVVESKVLQHPDD